MRNNTRFIRTDSATIRKKWDRNKYGFLFIAPWFIGFFVFNFYPLLYSLFLSFTNFSIYETYDFVGLRNYINLFTRDVRYQSSLGVTFRYVFIGVPFQLTFALLLAIVLNKGVPGLKYFRAIFYLPALLGGSVAISILWRQVFGINGIINDLLSYLGFSEAITSRSWVSNPNTAIYTLIILRVWQFGSAMIIFLAGLKQIPKELYESASIDGAVPARQFLHITMPLLTPIILFNVVMQIISAFQTFTQAFIIGGDTGGVMDSLLFYTLYLFIMGFKYFNLGIASAMAWVLLIIIAILTAIVFKSSTKWVHYE